MLKGVLLGAAIGLPLIWVVLTLMAKWRPVVAVRVVRLERLPAADDGAVSYRHRPLFNKFTPLADEALKSRIEGLMQRVGFASKGLFVMDGSKRSAHGNAYFPASAPTSASSSSTPCCRAWRRRKSKPCWRTSWATSSSSTSSSASP
jgi:hypothetical protein